MFSAGEKGCIPALAAGALGAAGVDGQVQSTTVPLLLGSQATTGTSTGVLQDYLALYNNVCITNGICCYTSLCNNSYKFSFNAIVLGFALMLSLILLR